MCKFSPISDPAGGFDPDAPLDPPVQICLSIAQTMWSTILVFIIGI